MIVLSNSVCIKCCKITCFTYFFFAMFLVATLSSHYYNSAKPAAWASAMMMNKVVQNFHWQVPVLKTNVAILDSRILQILKSLIPPRAKPQKRCAICATKGRERRFAINVKTALLLEVCVQHQVSSSIIQNRILFLSFCLNPCWVF